MKRVLTLAAAGLLATGLAFQPLGAGAETMGTAGKGASPAAPSVTAPHATGATTMPTVTDTHGSAGVARKTEELRTDGKKTTVAPATVTGAATTATPAVSAPKVTTAPPATTGTVGSPAKTPAKGAS